MSQPAHTSMSKDESLEERVFNFKTAYKNFQNIEASEQLSSNKDWQDRIGTTEEIQYAKQVAANTLDMAVARLSDKDIQDAKNQNMLTQQEISQVEALSASPEADQQVERNREAIKQARAQSANTSKDKDNSRDY